LRLSFIALAASALLACLQGCATQSPASRAAEQAALESEDDEFCQTKGARGSEAYNTCREQRAEAQARAAAIQEQKRRDFDRVLGQGTSGHSF
jgi:hypothetical protein